MRSATGQHDRHNLQESLSRL